MGRVVKGRQPRVRLAPLGATVFVAGFCTMGAEMAAPRLLAPYFGATQLVWASVIGTILAALAVGGFVGGRYADRWPVRRAYGAVLAASGALLSIVPLAARPLLQGASASLASLEMGSFALSLAAVSAFFFPPVFLLGMITPWAIRLGGAGRADLGRIAGILSGTAALGSILGTFATALAAIPLLGLQATLLAMSGALVATGAVFAGWPIRDSLAAFALLATVGWASLSSRGTDARVIYEVESAYQHLAVRGSPEGPRELIVDEGTGAQSVTLPSEGRVGGVWGALASTADLVVRPGRPTRILMIGLAGGTVAAQIERDHGARTRLEIDAVEIDPAIVEVGRGFFGLDRVRGLRVHIGDGRVALRRLRGPYDLILVDVFRGAYIPAHLATREFFQECRAKLAPDGVLAMNVAAGRSGSAMRDALITTLSEAFEEIVILDVAAGLSPIANDVLVGSSRDLARRGGPVLRSIPRDATRGGRLLTDDRSSIEILTDLSLLGLLGIR